MLSPTASGVDGGFGGVRTDPSSSLTTEFPKVQRLLRTVKKSLGDLEKDYAPTAQTQSYGDDYYQGGRAVQTGKLTAEQRFQLEHSVSVSINQLTRDSQALGILLSRESGARKDMWRHRVDQVTEEVTAIRKDLDGLYVKEHMKQKQEEEKNAILGGYGVYGGGARERLLDGARSRKVNRLEPSFAERQGLERSITSVDEMTQVGNAVLKNLRDQRNYLKSAQTKLLDLMNTLGVSKSLMGLIERRSRADRWLILLGVVVTLVVIGIVYHFFG